MLPQFARALKGDRADLGFDAFMFLALPRLGCIALVPLHLYFNVALAHCSDPLSYSYMYGFTVPVDSALLRRRLANHAFATACIHLRSGLP